MPAPTPMDCSNSDCSYSTPINIPSYDLVIKTLELHINSAHGQNVAAVTHNNTGDNSVKAERPKRPTVSLGFSESDWTFFVHKWKRYSRQTRIMGQQLLDELCSCMDDELEKLAFNEGSNADTEENLLAKIKNLAVTTRHPSVHVVNMHQMKQEENESTKAFSARVKGAAGNCNLQKICSKEGCNERVSFLEETCYHVVMSGLANPELREKVLTQAMLGNVTNLSTLLSYTAAEESAKLKNNLNEIGAINKKAPNQSKYISRKCSCCGQASHGENNKFRSTQCKAFGKSCTKCSKPNHFASVCKSKKIAASTASQENDEDDPSENAETPSIGAFVTALMANTHVSSPKSAKPIVEKLRAASNTAVNSLPIPHYIYDENVSKWVKKAPQSSPVITVTMSLDRAAYGELKLNLPKLVKKPGAGHSRARKATTDSGAQLTIMNVSELNILGIKTSP